MSFVPPFKPAQLRFCYIDAQRGIAALLVIWLHVTEVFVQLQGPGGWLYDVAKSLDFGRVGVILFFVISGFVVPSSLHPARSDSDKRPIRVFLIRRFFRLFPAYWASVAAAGILGWSLMTPHPGDILLANLTMVQGAFAVPDVIGLYWSLRVELVFYLLCILLFVTGALHRASWLASAVCASLFCFVVLMGSLHLAPASWPVHALRVPYYCMFIGFMFWGALFRERHDASGVGLETWGNTVLVGFPLIVAAIPIVLILLAAIRPNSMIDHFIRPAVAQALGIGLFLLLSVRWQLNGRIFVWLGEISYSLYLFHPIVFNVLYARVKSDRFLDTQEMHLAFFLVISVAGTICLATLVYYLVERPWISLGRRLT